MNGEPTRFTAKTVGKAGRDVCVKRDILGHRKKGGVISESPFSEINHAQQRAFLAAFQETGNVRRACKLAEVRQSSHYRWLKVDSAYRAAMERARIMAADILEAEAHRRAVEGVEEPVG